MAASWTAANSDARARANYDTNVSAPTTSITATLYPAEQYGYCPDAAVMALNYNWTAMTTLVNSMSPNGNTNQADRPSSAGCRWSAAGRSPLRPRWIRTTVHPGHHPADRRPEHPGPLVQRQHIVTSRRPISNGSTCNNINAAGITLYTVQVNTGGDPTSTLLQNCAGSRKYPDNSKFFLLTSSNQIVSTTFNRSAPTSASCASRSSSLGEARRLSARLTSPLVRFGCRPRAEFG